MTDLFQIAPSPVPPLVAARRAYDEAKAEYDAMQENDEEGLSEYTDEGRKIKRRYQTCERQLRNLESQAVKEAI